jgi:hypothetical protein
LADEAPTANDWQTVAAVAAAENVPARTLYNWIRTKSVASRMEGRVKLVRVQDVRAKLRARATLSVGSQMPANRTAAAGASAVNTAGGTGDGGNRAKIASMLNGDSEARIFSLLDEGLDPIAIVRQEHLPSAVVLEALRQHRALRDQQLPSGPSFKERFESVERVVSDVFERVGEIQQGLGATPSRDELRALREEIKETLKLIVGRLERVEQWRR